MLRHVIHYFLHLVFPYFLAKKIDKNDYLKVYFALLSSMLIDLDHLFADPIFDPNRCSIDFHFLHQTQFFFIYLVGFLFAKNYIKIFFLGLMLHLITDKLDCILVFTK